MKDFINRRDFLKVSVLVSSSLCTGLTLSGIDFYYNKTIEKKGTYKFRIGDFECVCLSDGGYNYNLEDMFSNVPTDRIKEVLLKHGMPTDYIWTPYTYLFINTGENRVLIDMGAGQLYDTTGKLLSNMKLAEIAPDSIDTVLITHAHPDHIGGALDENDKPVYTNAQYFIWKEEWDFWFSESAFEKAPEEFIRIARKNLGPLKDRVNLVDRESEILPGINMIPAPGHTPGHAVVSLSSGDEQLFYIGDTVLHPLHLEHPDWSPVYDIIPEKAAISKCKIFDLVADLEAWVIGQHFPPFPSLGHVTKQDVGWKWHPITEI